MGLSLMDKLANFLMPVDETVPIEEDKKVPDTASFRERRAQLKVHGQTSLKVMVVSVQKFDDVQMCADYIKSGVAVIVNFENADSCIQQRVNDFLNGVCYVLSGNCQRVTDFVFMYAPAIVDINKELYAFSVPTYVKKRNEI